MDSQKKTENTSYSYHYREIICGYCRHRFVFNKDPGEWGYGHYYKKKDGTMGIETKCPSCGEMVVSFDDEIEALPFVLREDRDDIEVHGFRGI